MKGANNKRLREFVPDVGKVPPRMLAWLVLYRSRHIFNRDLRRLIGLLTTSHARLLIERASGAVIKARRMPFATPDFVLVNNLVGKLFVSGTQSRYKNVRVKVKKWQDEEKMMYFAWDTLDLSAIIKYFEK